MNKRIQFSTSLVTVLLLFCASAFATEPDESLKNKHNPDQHHNVTDNGWYTLYYDPGLTNVYVTCDGVTPNNENNLDIKCQSPAVWGTCTPNEGHAETNVMCLCDNHGTEQHSGQYSIINCYK